MTLALLASFAAQPAWADNSGSITSVSNSASIASYTNTGTIHNPGTTGFDNNGTIGIFTNSGLITANNFAVHNSGSIDTLINTRTLAANTAILNRGHIGTLNNSGQIISSGQSLYQSGTIDLFTNTGTITGSRVVENLGSIGTIDNQGIIDGSQAIQIESNGSLGTLVNSGTIGGAITNFSANTLRIAGGSGTVFGTLTGDAAVTTSTINGTLNTTIGSFSSIGAIDSLGDVIFISGNQLLNDNITVNSGNGTVTNSGYSVLQLNNLISISGSYVQSAGATLAIGVSDSAVATGDSSTDSGYGRLVVSGSAYLASGATILLKALNSYAFASGQRYVVIEAAASGTNYNASTLNYTLSGQGSSGLQASGAVSTDNTTYANLVVSIADATGSTAIARYANTSNAVSTLDGLFKYSGTNQSLLDVFNPAIALSTTTSANRAGAQLSPAATGDASINAVNTATDAVQTAARNRLDSLRTAQTQGGSGIATGESTLAPALWGRLFGGHAVQGERDGVAGYHASFSGFLLGGDARVAPDWRAGALFSYARINVGNDDDNSGSSAHVNSYGMTAYAAYDGRPWYVNLTAGAARQQYSTNRLVSYTGFSGTNQGSFNGLLYTTTAQAGYPLAVGAGTLTPSTGLAYTSLRQAGYSESGSAAALAVNASHSSSLKSEIALKWEQSLLTRQGELKPFAQLGWHHEFHANALTTSAAFVADSTGSTAFTTQGASPLRNTAQLSLGATLVKSRNLSLAARYTIEAARGYVAQTGDVSLRWDF